MNPYKSLSERSFWRPAVADRHFNDIEEICNPSFFINEKDKVATYGSCFAQHIGKALKQRKFNWLVTEKRPFGMSDAHATKFNYDVFSSRTGNIYTTSLLNQWLDWSFGQKDLLTEYWEKGGRYFDPFRPNVEPNGFSSLDELLKSRQSTLDMFRKSVECADVLVFTMGLTESWFNSEHNYEYPMCPGTVAGEFDSRSHKFVNQSFSDIKKMLVRAVNTMRDRNKKLKVVLTVSPVPLTATYSGQHVLVANMHSKSVLRSVAEEVSSELKDVDYFPSYEIITSHPFKGCFYEPNLRQVNSLGVDTVMRHFFTSFTRENEVADSAIRAGVDPVDEVCEEAFLDNFADER